MSATQRSFQAAAALAFAKCAYYPAQALFLQKFYLEGQDQWHGWLSHPVKALKIMFLFKAILLFCICFLSWFYLRNLDLSKFCIGMKDEMQQPPIYDLYAVINHYGGMIGGHYTAYARLPSDKNSQRSDVGQFSQFGQFSFHDLISNQHLLTLTSLLLVPLVGWRLFDDSTVTMVEESQVVTRYAYVLFYRRRNSPVERQAHFHRPGAAESPTAAGAAASQVRVRSVPTGNSSVV